MIYGWRAALRAAPFFMLVAGLALAGCADDDPAPTPTAPADSTASAVTARDAWVRATPGEDAGQMTGAYLTLNNTGAQDERLIAVRAEGVGTVEIHETTHEGEVMRMQPVDGIDVPAGGEVALAPGGLHLMLLDLAGPLAPGDTVALTLEFASGLTVPVEAEVRALAE